MLVLETGTPSFFTSQLSSVWGRDQERTPPLTRDQAGKQGDERPVRPVEAGPAGLAAEHRQMVAQVECLGVLR